MEQAPNGARLASNGLWVWRSGGYYGFGKTPELAFRNAEHNYVALPQQHEAMIEYIKAGYSD